MYVLCASKQGHFNSRISPYLGLIYSSPDNYLVITRSFTSTSILNSRHKIDTHINQMYFANRISYHIKGIFWQHNFHPSCKLHETGY